MNLLSLGSFAAKPILAVHGVTRNPVDETEGFDRHRGFRYSKRPKRGQRLDRRKTVAAVRPNRVKQRLAQGQHALCFAAWGYGGADHLERLGPAEPDGVWLEGEHGEVDFGDLSNLTRAIDLIGATPIVRVHQNQAGLIYRCLDLGAMGIAVPHVNTRGEAEALVQAGKFWPIGQRGSFTSRQGLGVPDYFQRANDQTMLMVLLEDVVAIDNLDEILTVEHIDVFFVAPGDLAQTMGLPGMAGDPRVQALVDETLSRVVKAGKTAGALVTQDTIQHHYDLGVRLFLSGPASWLAAGYQQLDRAAGGTS